MAEAAVMMPETPSAPPSETAPGTRTAPGRKPGYKPFNNEVTPEDFFVMLNDIDDADWPKSLVYVWRRDPFTDNTNGGREPKYIDVINRAVTEMNVKEEHGSGTYKLQLNTNDKYVAHTILSLEDPKYPPHVPPGDWFNNPRNKKWLTWKPLVEKWWAENLKQLAGPSATPANDSAALDQLARLVGQLASNKQPNESDALSKMLVTWALQQTADERKSERDADSPGKLAELIRAVKELSPPAAAPAQDNTLLTFVMTQLTEVQKTNAELVKMMLTQKNEAAKQPDPLSQVESMSKLIAAVAGIAQPAAPKEPWVETVETLGPQVISALDKFATGMAMRNTMPPRPQPGMMPQPRPMTQQPNPAQVIPVQSQPIPQPAGNEPPPPATPAVTTAVPGEPEMDTGLRSMLFQVAVLSANALNLGMDGDQFADQICYKFGQAVYDQFISNVPKETLIDKFKSVQEAWQMVEPYSAQLPGFIDSFYAYATQSDDDETKSISPDEPDEDEPEPVTAVKSAKKKPKKK